MAKPLVAFPYFGGKNRHLAWLLPLLPDMPAYCEPFCGAASVLLNRKRAKIETINDLDGRVVNFFRVLRENPVELLWRIRLTPYARAEYDACRESLKEWSGAEADDVEWAREYAAVQMTSLNVVSSDKFGNHTGPAKKTEAARQALCVLCAHHMGMGNSGWGVSYDPVTRPASKGNTAANKTEAARETYTAIRGGINTKDGWGPAYNASKRAGYKADTAAHQTEAARQSWYAMQGAINGGGGWCHHNGSRQPLSGGIISHSRTAAQRTEAAREAYCVQAAGMFGAIGQWGHSADISVGTTKGVSASSRTDTWAGALEAIMTSPLGRVAERLLGVQIECRPALEVIQRYDTPDTLTYCDPPYVHAARKGKSDYSYEMTDADHRELAATLHACKGYVAISGYDSELYGELYGDWYRHEAPAKAASSTRGINGGKGVTDLRTEVLWTNYDPAGLAQGRML